MPVAAMAVMHRQRSLVLQGLLQWQHCLQEDLNESLKPMFDNYNIFIATEEVALHPTALCVLRVSQTPSCRRRQSQCLIEVTRMLYSAGHSTELGKSVRTCVHVNFLGKCKVSKQHIER